MACYLETIRYDEGQAKWLLGDVSQRRIQYLSRLPVMDFGEVLHMGTQYLTSGAERGFAFETAAWLLFHYLVNTHPQETQSYLARLQTGAKRMQLVVRVPTGPRGVALHDGRTLPDLPPGVAQVLSGTRRSGALPVGGAVVARQAVPWVVSGSEQVKFTVRKGRATGG